LNRKNFLAATVLTALMFALAFIPLSGSQTTFQYDPWADINDDGKIDAKDIGYVCRLFGTTGTPINKTALLLEPLKFACGVIYCNPPSEKMTNVRHGLGRIPKYIRIIAHAEQGDEMSIGVFNGTYQCVIKRFIDQYNIIRTCVATDAIIWVWKKGFISYVNETIFTISWPGPITLTLYPANILWEAWG